MNEINQLITRKQTEQDQLGTLLADLKKIASSIDNTELQNKIRRTSCSVNRTFCLFDEFECLYEENIPTKTESSEEVVLPIKPATREIETQTDEVKQKVDQNDSVIDWKSMVEAEPEAEIVEINFKTEQPRKISVQSVASSPSPPASVTGDKPAENPPAVKELRRSSRNSSRSASPETMVKKFQQILVETQRNALEAKKMIDEVKTTEVTNNNKRKSLVAKQPVKKVEIKGKTKLTKYRGKAKSHGGNENNSSNHVLPVKRARKSIDDTIERIKKKRDNSFEMTFEEMVMQNAVKFYKTNFAN